jgi:hypothetical protein
MYHEKMLAVAKIENGFLIEVRAAYKKEKQSDDEKSCPCMVESDMHYGEKEIYAKDAMDLGKKIELLIPMLDEKFGSESEFDAAFKAVK